VGLALGLACAFAWGLSDWFSTLASRRIGALASVLGFHVLSVVGLAIAVVATDALDGFGAKPVLVLAAIGAVSSIFYPVFYKALAIGPISIVSPIVSGYAAVTVLLAVVILDEGLGGGRLAAVLVAFLGVALASSDVAQLHRIERRQLLGLGLAVVAAVAGGVGVFGISYYSDELGWLGPIFVARCFTGALIALLCVRGGRWRIPARSRGVLALIGAIAALDTAGFVAFNIGVREADTSLIATASSPYAIVPIVLGVTILHERPKPVQWLGITFVIAGLILLGLFS
jgi:drug/metabolite transporter (DMT)-like permease